MSGFDHEHGELLSALRGETCDEASRGRMREKLATAGVLSVSVSAATAGTASALAHAAPAAQAGKVGALLKALTAGKLLGGGVLVVVGAVVVASLARPAERPLLPPAQPSEQALKSPPPAPAVLEASAVEKKAVSEAARAPVTPKRARPIARKSALARESALLSSAARRLHAGDLPGAIRLLDEHERSFPDGELRAERELACERVESELRARKAP
jgi:hypothetical protein